MAKPMYYYGIHAVNALLQNRPHDALSLYMQVERLDDPAMQPIVELAHSLGITLQATSKEKLTQLCDTAQHQGVVLHARPKLFDDESLITSLASSPQCLFLLLDQVTDAHNLGACLRTAAAMGVDAVVIPKNHSANLTPTVAKVSVGGMESIPVIQVTNLSRCIIDLKHMGVFVYGLALDASAKPIDRIDMTGKVAIVMGSEGDGLRRLTQENCDELAYIPMQFKSASVVESLNVSVATGMVLFEVQRQRRLS